MLTELRHGIHDAVANRLKCGHSRRGNRVEHGGDLLLEGVNSKAGLGWSGQRLMRDVKAQGGFASTDATELAIDQHPRLSSVMPVHGKDGELNRRGTAIDNEYLHLT